MKFLFTIFNLIIVISSLFSYSHAIPFVSEIERDLSSVDFTTQTLSIMYFLNQNSDTVQIQIIDQGTGLPVATFDGITTLGMNTVIWNGREDNDTGTPIPAGNYGIQVRSINLNGYASWTEISSNSAGAALSRYSTLISGYPGRGITVDNSTSSPYFGRVYVSQAGTNATFNKGILRYRPDLSTYTNESDYIISSPGTGGSFPGSWNLTSGGTIPWGISVAEDGEIWVSGQPTAGGIKLGRGLPSDISPTSVDSSVSVSPIGCQITGSGANRILWWGEQLTQGLFKNVTVGNNTGNSINLYNLAINTVINFGESMYARQIRFDDEGNLYVLARMSNSTRTTMLFRWDASTAQNIINYPLTRSNASWDLKVTTNEGTYGNGLTITHGDSSNFSDDSIYVFFMGHLSKGVYLAGTSGQGINKVNLTIGANRLFDLPESNTNSVNAIDLGSDYAGNLYTMNGSAEVLRVYTPPGASDITIPAYGSKIFTISNSAVPVDLSLFNTD